MSNVHFSFLGSSHGASMGRVAESCLGKFAENYVVPGVTRDTKEPDIEGNCPVLPPGTTDPA